MVDRHALVVLSVAVAVAVFFGAVFLFTERTDDEAWVELVKISEAEVPEGSDVAVITNEDLQAEPLLADVLDAFYNTSRYPGAERIGESTLQFTTTYSEAVRLLHYLEARGTSVVRYGEDYFSVGIIVQ